MCATLIPQNEVRKRSSRFSIDCAWRAGNRVQKRRLTLRDDASPQTAILAHLADQDPVKATQEKPREE